MSFREILNCKNCALYKTRSNVVVGRGLYDKARLLLIGEAPGLSEDALGMAFIGESGKLLDRMLIEAGYKMVDCFFTNCILCRPCDSPLGENRELNRAEVFACLENTKEIINSVNNKLGTILLGKEAKKWFYKRVSDFPVLIIPHPSALLRQGGAKSSMYSTTISEMIRFRERIGL